MDALEQLKQRMFGDVMGILRSEGIATFDPVKQVLHFEGSITQERLNYLAERI